MEDFNHDEAKCKTCYYVTVCSIANGRGCEYYMPIESDEQGDIEMERLDYKEFLEEWNKYLEESDDSLLFI